MHIVYLPLESLAGSKSLLLALTPILAIGITIAVMYLIGKIKRK